MIRGKNVFLRAIEQHDAVRCHGWLNDDEFPASDFHHAPVSLSATMDWLRTQAVSSPSQMTLVIQVEGGDAIGLMGLRGISTRSRRAEIWMNLADKTPERVNHGRDALAALTRHAFEGMNLNRLWTEAAVQQHALQSIFEEIGFRREGILREAFYRRGGYRDTCVMGLLHRDWRLARDERLMRLIPPPPPRPRFMLPPLPKKVGAGSPSWTAGR